MSEMVRYSAGTLRKKAVAQTKGKGGVKKAVVRRVARKQSSSPWPLPSEKDWQPLGCSQSCNAQRDTMDTRVQCVCCDRQWHTACLDLPGDQAPGQWY